MNWFRWYHGTTTDPKLTLIAHLSKEPLHLVLAVWASLLEVASQSHPRGDISSFDPECHAVTLQALQKQIVTIMDFMTQKEMIKDGEICKWGKRQFGSESLERVRKYRENKKTENVTVTPCNVTSVTSVNVTPEEKRIDKPIRVVTLPEWLPLVPWQEYIEMRKRLKKPMTDYAANLRIKDLEKLKGEGHPPESVLNQSISNSWTDLYPLKKQVKESQPSQRYN